ncbi:MAG: polyprenyl synthetase family protein [Desulfomonilia bacterium]|nr:polyprenyl synthetase family protein [Desulfomonilia bacterium]
MAVDIDALLKEKKDLFNDCLTTYLSSIGVDSGVYRAFAYSLCAGGKRIRPILTMLACEAMGGKDRDALPAGLAIEMIHTFSLIHDDLPALDNDTLRRGRPTCHAQFGEATAILAGDALIFQALSLLCSSFYSDEVKVDLCCTISDVCGFRGLVQGEYEDVMAEGAQLDLAQIEDIYRKKTSRLFELCMYAGGRIVSEDAARISSLRTYGTYLGLAYQAIDDILDVTTSDTTLGKTSGKDLLQDKATVVKAIGIDRARAWAVASTEKALKSIEGSDLKKQTELRDLAQWMLKRVM